MSRLRLPLILSLALSMTWGCIGPKRQDRAQSRADLGAAYLRERNVPDAIAALREGAKLDPRNHSVWDKLGLAYAAQGANEEAEKAFLRAVHLNDEKAELHNNYGLFLLSQRRTDEAIAQFQAAKKDLTYRKPAIVLSNLGYALMLANRPAEAVTELDQAIVRAPNLCQARFNRGLVLRSLERGTQALTDFEAVIQMCGDEAAGAYMQAAPILLQQGERDAGCTYLRTVVHEAPGSRLAADATDLLRQECG